MPYPSDSLGELFTALRHGRLRPPPASRVPARIYRLIARGLAPDAKDRHPDMATLLHALARDPAVAWRRAGALLATNPQLTQASIEALEGPKEKWVNLENHIPVHLMYFTLRVDENGTIRNYGDVYGHNKKLIELLNAE